MPEELEIPDQRQRPFVIKQAHNGGMKRLLRFASQDLRLPLIAGVALVLSATPVAAVPVVHSQQAVVFAGGSGSDSLLLTGIGGVASSELLTLRDTAGLSLSQWGQLSPEPSFARLAVSGDVTAKEAAGTASAPGSADAGHVSLPGTLILVGLGLALLWGTPLTAALQHWLRRRWVSTRPGWSALSRF